MASQKARRPPSVDCSSRPTGRRANMRRFVNLLQQLGGALSEVRYCHLLAAASPRSWRRAQILEKHQLQHRHSEWRNAPRRVSTPPEARVTQMETFRVLQA